MHDPAIEFVDGPTPDGPDAETLDAGRARPSRRIVVLVAVVAAAAGIGWTALRGSGAHETPNAATPVPTAAAPTPTSTPTPTPTEPLTFTAARPTTCPANVSCVLDIGLPSAVTRAVLDTLPGFPHVTAAQTVRTLRHELWFRQIVARTSSLTAVIDIQHRDAAPLQLVARGPKSGDVAYARQYSGGYLVQIEITGPPPQLPATGVLLRLAHDERLLTLG